MFTQDTIRLVVEFKDFDRNVISPDNVTLTIYDESQNIVEVITDDIVQDKTKYYYDYQAIDSNFVFEFSGFYNAKKVLARQLVKTKFN